MCLIILNASVFAGIFDDYQNKVKIVFKGYNKPEILTNFPLLVVLGTNINGFSYSKFKSSGNDLRFSDSSETIELPYEVEKWNTNEQSYVWVKVPLIQSSNAYIWAFFGKSGVPPPSYSHGSVWDKSIGIWHMHVLNATDSSSNSFNGTAGASVSLITTGKIGNALNFLGGASSAYFVSVPSNSAFALTGPYTISAWVFARGNNRRFVGTATSSSGYTFYTPNNAGITNNLAFFVQLGSAYTKYSNYSINSNAWKHVAFVRNGGTGLFYVDGKRVASVTGLTDTHSGSTLHLGNGGARTTGYSWNGFLDEIRIHNTAMSSNWIWASVVNQASNNVFCNYGPVIRNSKGSVFMIL